MHLRDAPLIAAHMTRAVSLGLSKSNCAPYFAALELMREVTADGKVAADASMGCPTLALSAFVEPVECAICTTVPTTPTFLSILEGKAAQWKELLQPGLDFTRRDAILSFAKASTSASIGEIETE